MKKESELVIVSRAIECAQRAYYESLDNEGYDPAFFNINIKIEFMDCSIEEVLRTIEIKNRIEKP